MHPQKTPSVDNTKSSKKSTSNIKGPTTWMERFRDALTIMCGTEPPLKFCEMWVNHEQENNADPLQNWVGMQKATPSWAQCIVTIDAAMVWADTPVEGDGHQ
jgi:hypothetical protein